MSLLLVTDVVDVSADILQARFRADSCWRCGVISVSV